MATKKAETKTKTEIKTEAKKLETQDEYVEITIPIDDSTDEETLYVAVNGVGMHVPYGETVKVRYPFAAEIRRCIATKDAARKKRDEAKRNAANSNMYVNSTY